MAAVVRGAEWQAGEQRDNERGHRGLGGAEGARSGAVEEEPQGHAGRNVVAEEDRPRRVLGALREPLSQACSTAPSISSSQTLATAGPSHLEVGCTQDRGRQM